MKSEEEEAEKEEKLGEKLRRGVLVGKSRGPSTPFPSWLSLTHTNKHIRDHSLSSRKLAAALWEFNHSFPLFQMHRSAANHAPPPAAAAAAAPDPRHRRHHYILHKDKALHISNFLADASPSSPDQVPSVFFFFLLRIFVVPSFVWDFVFRGFMLCILSYQVRL